MGFFDNDDSFESLIDRMFGGAGNFVEYRDSNGKRQVYREGNETSFRNFIETKKFFYFVLDLSNMNSVEVNVRDPVLEIRGSNGNVMEYALPKNIAKKKFEWKFNNGILEVEFRK